MRGSSAISMIHHLKLSKEYCEDFVRQHPSSRGALKFIEYKRRIEWLFKDIITYPHFREEVRNGIKLEIESDAFSYQSLVEKLALLNPEQRDNLEGVIDMILNNETIKVEKI
jgi:hypothetical protein